MQLGTNVEHTAIEPRVVAALREQRARFERAFSGFDAADWGAPTRCDAWNAQQVVIHVCGASTACARVLRGGPDESVAPNFDPNTTPRLHVDSRAGESPDVTLDYWDYQARVTYDPSPGVDPSSFLPSWLHPR